MSNKEYTNQVDHSQKASNSVKKYFWRIWALDKMMTSALIISLSMILLPKKYT